MFTVRKKFRCRDKMTIWGSDVFREQCRSRGILCPHHTVTLRLCDWSHTLCLYDHRSYHVLRKVCLHSCNDYFNSSIVWWTGGASEPDGEIQMGYHTTQSDISHNIMKAGLQFLLCMKLFKSSQNISYTPSHDNSSWVKVPSVKVSWHYYCPQYCVPQMCLCFE